jgi:hypothetical protein
MTDVLSHAQDRGHSVISGSIFSHMSSTTRFSCQVNSVFGNLVNDERVGLLPTFPNTSAAASDVFLDTADQRPACRFAFASVYSTKTHSMLTWSRSICLRTCRLLASRKQALEALISHARQTSDQCLSVSSVAQLDRLLVNSFSGVWAGSRSFDPSRPVFLRLCRRCDASVRHARPL